MFYPLNYGAILETSKVKLFILKTTRLKGMFLACMANEQLYIFGDSQNLLLFYQKLLQDIMKKRIFKVTFFSISILFISCSLIEKYQGTDKKFETEVSKLEALREYEDKKFVISNIPLRKRKGTLGSLSIFVGVFEDTIKMVGHLTQLILQLYWYL